jgi:hypothetical protein
VALPGASSFVAFDASGVSGAVLARGVTGAVKLRTLVSSPLPPGALVPSPHEANLADGDAVREAVSHVARALGARPGRLTLILPDGAVRNTWLRVTVLATAATGLPAADRFDFGNLPGDTGNDRGAPRVDVLDVAHTRGAVGSVDAASLDRFDFNCDGAINAVDVLIARLNQRAALPLLSAPPAGVPAAEHAPLPVVGVRSLARPPRRSALIEAEPVLLG